jgi:hypothetical protein
LFSGHDLAQLGAILWLILGKSFPFILFLVAHICGIGSVLVLVLVLLTILAIILAVLVVETSCEWIVLIVVVSFDRVSGDP